MCISHNSKAVLIAKNRIEMYGNSMMLLLDAIMLKANTAPNSSDRLHISTTKRVEETKLLPSFSRAVKLISV